MVQNWKHWKKTTHTHTHIFNLLKVECLKMLNHGMNYSIFYSSINQIKNIRYNTERSIYSKKYVIY